MKKHDAEKSGTNTAAAEHETHDATTTGSTEPLTPEDRIHQLEEQLASKEKECRENWDRFVRERADLENYRKRANREKEELLNYGTKSLIEEILPVLDNMERALAHSDEETLPAVLEGVHMTHGMLLTVLKKFGVTPVESVGGPFDPAFHQAMTQVATDEHPPNIVVEEFQKGYMLRERLLRPSMVSVSTPANKE